METRRGYMLLAQWGLLILPLGVALTLFFPIAIHTGPHSFAFRNYFSELLVGAGVTMVIFSALTTLVALAWMLTRRPGWRYAAASVALVCGGVGFFVAVFGIYHVSEYTLSGIHISLSYMLMCELLALLMVAAISAFLSQKPLATLPHP